MVVESWRAADAAREHAWAILGSVDGLGSGLGLGLGLCGVGFEFESEEAEAEEVEEVGVGVGVVRGMNGGADGCDSRMSSEVEIRLRS